MNSISSTLFDSLAISSSRSWNLPTRVGRARSAARGAQHAPVFVVQLDGGHHCAGGGALHISDHTPQRQHLQAQSA
jgi:hypothetical protein